MLDFLGVLWSTWYLKSIGWIGSYVDGGLKDPSIIGNNASVDFNDKNFDDVRFVKLNSIPAVGKHAAVKNYVDQVFLIASTNHHQ